MTREIEVVCSGCDAVLFKICGTNGGRPVLLSGLSEVNYTTMSDQIHKILTSACESCIDRAVEDYVDEEQLADIAAKNEKINKLKKEVNNLTRSLHDQVDHLEWQVKTKDEEISKLKKQLKRSIPL